MANSPIVPIRCDEKLLKEAEEKRIDKRKVFENALRIELIIKGKNALDNLVSEKIRNNIEMEKRIEEVKKEYENKNYLLESKIDEEEKRLDRQKHVAEILEKDAFKEQMKMKKREDILSFLSTLDEVKRINQNNFKDVPFLQGLDRELSVKYPRYNEMGATIGHLSLWFKQNNGHPVEVKA